MPNTTTHYQAKFTSLEEATTEAKKASKSLGKALYVIQSKAIFFVDESAPTHKWEKLLGAYDSGRKMDLPKAPEPEVKVAEVKKAEPQKQKGESIHISKGDGVTVDIALDLAHLGKAVQALRAVNHKLRKKMMVLMEDQPGISVTEIYVKMKLEQSVTSQHLSILRKAGIVTTKRDGKTIQYFLNKKRIAEICALLPQLAKESE